MFESLNIGQSGVSILETEARDIRSDRGYESIVDWSSHWPRCESQNSNLCHDVNQGFPSLYCQIKSEVGPSGQA